MSDDLDAKDHEQDDSTRTYVRRVKDAGVNGRVKRLEDDVKLIRETLVTNNAAVATISKQVSDLITNTNALVLFFKQSKGIVGFIQKNSGRILLIIMGIAVGRGWITKETSDAIHNVTGI